MVNNLNLTQITSSQNNKEITINDANGELDAAITEVLAVPVDDTNTVTLTTAQLQRNQYFSIDEGTPVPNAAITVTLPAIERGTVTFLNNTTQVATVEIGLQTVAAPILQPGEVAQVVIEGANVRRADNADEIELFVQGTPTGSDVVYQKLVRRPFTLPAGMAGSGAFTRVTTAGATAFDVQRNGVNQGTINFAAATAAATFTLASAVTFAADDRLAIVAPAAPGTLEDISITLLILLS